MKDKNPKISVIVPVYNTAEYLPKCIESILNQTFTDFELLLINDGSKDNSGVICDEYAAKDKRIRVFHKKNGGVSSARNIGLDNVKGEYICFIDSDDWVEDDYIAMLLCPVSSHTDFVLSGMIFNSSDGHILKIANFPTVLFSMEINSFIPLIFKSNLGPCCKLFKSSLIRTNKLKYDTSISIGEDTLFVLKYIDCISSISFIEKASYHYIRFSNSNSLSTKLINADELLYFHNKMFQWVYEKHKERQVIDRSFLYFEDKNFILGYLKALINTKNDNYDFHLTLTRLKEIRLKQKDYLKLILSDSWKTRIFRSFLLYSPTIFLYLTLSILQIKYFK